MSIVFVMQSIPAPHHVKRIQALATTHSITVVCARRINMDMYDIVKIPNVEYRVIDMIIPPSSKPIKRILSVLKFQKFVKNELRILNPKIAYVVGLDTLSIVCKYTDSSVSICYDVADLRESLISEEVTLREKLSVRGLIDSYIRWKEHKLSHRVNLLILTSRKFYDVHYYKMIPKENMIEIPNMPNLNAFNGYARKRGGRFTIGFVGALRYINQMYMLVDAAKEADVDVIFSGATDLDSNHKFQDYCNDKPWVTFTGKYDFAKDIANIYGRIDCVYSVYDASNLNVRVALPNKLYEAAICRLPIIVAKNTYLWELVEQWGTGVGVKFDDINELIEIINHLKRKDSFYQKFVDNCSNVIPQITINKYLKNFCMRVDSLLNNK